jgi:dihydrofolate reductase
MRISLIVAMTDNRVMGADNQLPWRLPADLKRFKKLTLGKPVIMGRKTWESLRKPLPERKNIVVTRDEGYQAQGGVVATSAVEALAEAGDAEEVMIIGGAELYSEFLPRADRIHMTLIHSEIDGDVRFPEFDREEWIEKSRRRHPADENHAYPYTFVRLDRHPRAKTADAV